jgi:peptidase M48-like protein
VECGASRSARWIPMAGILFLFLAVSGAAGQQPVNLPEVPSNFKLDMAIAARMRPQLIAQSLAPSGSYATGRLVFERLLAQVRTPANFGFSWTLRIVEDDQLNAYSSPDGTVYVENGLAQLAGPSMGLWAAILSHEIAHVTRRDWARRYLYERSLQNDTGGAIVLGDPGLPSASWATSEKVSEDLARACRQLEIEADREGLMLMARAGYHPDFVPALHHLLHAQGSRASTTSLYAMHPCWEERDHQLSRAYLEASIQFDRLWPARYASPGGNPPVVVFAEEPTIRKTGAKEWELQLPIRCQNLAGAVEVVLLAGTPLARDSELAHLADLLQSGRQIRQLTGCTSPTTTITFALADISNGRKTIQHWTDVYVLDAWGAILARADVPKPPR